MHTAVNLFRSNTDDGVFGGKHEFSIFFRLPDIIDGRPVPSLLFSFVGSVLFYLRLRCICLSWNGREIGLGKFVNRWSVLRLVLRIVSLLLLRFGFFPQPAGNEFIRIEPFVDGRFHARDLRSREGLGGFRRHAFFIRPIT